DLPVDGAVKTDAVLAMATSDDGSRGWVVGGYAGSVDAAGRGSAAVLAARPVGWQTSSIWRYDDTADPSPPAAPPPAAPDLPAAGAVPSASLSGPRCRGRGSPVQDPHPDGNLQAAATAIAADATQPGGPSFAVLGGNARGPIDPASRKAQTALSDLPLLGGLL